MPGVWSFQISRKFPEGLEYREAIEQKINIKALDLVQTNTKFDQQYCYR